MLLYRLIMKKICEILLLSAILYISVEANSEIGRYQVGKTESGRYLAHINSGQPYICHFWGPANKHISEICSDKNKGNKTGGEYAYTFPRIGSSYPACPPLPSITNGYWKCPELVYSTAVEVYASCAAICVDGFKLKEAKVIRCTESLKWEESHDLHCFPENESCSLWNLTFITSTPLQVIISWNTTAACHNDVYKLLMKGPNQNFTKQLQKNSNFIVIKNIHPDMEYEVSIYLKEEQLISGNFTSAAMGSPQKPVDVYVYPLNATAVNITWTANKYMWAIGACIIGTCFISVLISFCVCWKRKRHKSRRNLSEGDVRNSQETQHMNKNQNTDALVENPTCTTTLLKQSVVSEFSSSKASHPSTSDAELNLGNLACEVRSTRISRNVGPRETLGSDSGRGSESGTDSTESDTNKLRWSQSSEKSLQERICEENVKENDLKDQSLTVCDKEKRIEDNIHLDDAEKCTCTFSAFQDSHCLEHIERLADLLDPHDHYTDPKSWKGLAKHVLHWDSAKIIAVGFRTKNFFKDFVLEHLSSEGKKLGHLVFYFSRSDTYREDVIELMNKIHSECSFCDQIFESQYPS
uniref:Uncharacterized protein LOC111127022 n=1 Tax=Crassostrea virginica TaxID=6565 RepID=A0A8B8DHV2_CRAVI|nr:uncharacterized protein LOC111127022 [Crassostrea virginica]